MSEYIYASDGEPLTNASGEIVLARHEIVRCKDCDYYDHWEALGSYREKHACGYWDYLEIELDGFCAWGERRERESAEVWNQWSADDVTCSEES